MNPKDMLKLVLAGFVIFVVSPLVCGVIAVLINHAAPK